MSHQPFSLKYMPFGDGFGGRKIRIVDVRKLCDKIYAQLPIDIILNILHHWYLFKLTLFFGQKRYDLSNFFGRFRKDRSRRIYVIYAAFWIKSSRQLRFLPVKRIKHLYFRTFFFPEVMSNELVSQLESLKSLVGVYVENDKIFHTLKPTLSFLQISVDAVDENLIQGLNRFRELRKLRVWVLVPPVVSEYDENLPFSCQLSITNKDKDEAKKKKKEEEERKKKEKEELEKKKKKEGGEVDDELKGGWGFIIRTDLNFPHLRALEFHCLPETVSFRFTKNLRYLTLQNSTISDSQMVMIVCGLKYLRSLVLADCALPKSSTLILAQRKPMNMIHPSEYKHHFDDGYIIVTCFDYIEKVKIINCEFSMFDWESVNIRQSSTLREITISSKDISKDMVKKLLEFENLRNMVLRGCKKIEKDEILVLDKKEVKTAIEL